jgi:hypothetical protein
VRFAITAALCVALGAAARIYQYASNFSLNHDDAALALNVMHRDIGQLSGRLDHSQLAPLGFLALERVIVVLLGASEWALRLPPFVASLAALGAFVYLAWDRLPRPEATLAIGFFAFSQAIAGAAIQVKHYSIDVLVAILLLIVCRPILEDDARPEVRHRAAMALAGAISVWFSFTAVFVLAGIGLASLYRSRSADRLRALAAIGFAWISSSAIYTGVALRHQMRDSQLFDLWSHELPAGTLTGAAQWLVQRGTNLGEVSTSVRLAPVCAIVLVVAVWLMARSPHRFNLALALIMAVTLAAAWAGWYPFVGRFLFFSAPVALLIIVGEIGRWCRRQTPLVRRAVAASALAALAYSSASFVKHSIAADAAFDDPRGIYRYMRANEREGDLVYASSASIPTLLYYDPALAKRHTPVGSWPNHTARVWFFFFWPTEPRFDIEAVDLSHRAALRIDATTRKLHRASLWTINPAFRPSSR